MPSVKLASPDRSPWLWRVLALSFAALSLYLLLRPPQRVTATHEAETEDSSLAADERRSTRAAARLHGDPARLIALVQRAGSSQARCTALARLARATEDEDALSHVLRYSERSQPLELRMCAASALGETTATAVIPWLLELARDPVQPVSEAAIRALALRDDEAARRALIGLGEGAPMALRVGVAVALAEAGATEAVAMIQGLLESASLQDKQRLVAALGGTHDPRALTLLTSFVQRGPMPMTYAAVSALGELGGAGASRALLELFTARPNLAHPVAAALARIGDEEARAALVDAAEGASGMAGSAALQALSSLEGEEVRALMLRAIESGRPDRVGVATEYLATRRDPEAVERLTAVLDRGLSHASHSALWALSRIGGEAAEQRLLAAAQKDGPMREAALGALASSPEGAEAARKIALEQLRTGKGASPQALELVAQDGSPEARELLVSAARREGRTSAHALMLLGQRGDPESRRVLDEIASDDKASSERRSQALFAIAQSGDPKAIASLTPALRASDPTLRARAVSAVGQLGGPEAEAALIAASRDNDPQVVASAAEMLAQTGSAPALARLEQVAASSDVATAQHGIRALAMVAPERAAPLVEKLAQSSDANARQTALGMVYSLPPAMAGKIVASALRDPAQVDQALSMVQGGYEDDSTREALRGVVTNMALPESTRERASRMLAGEAPMEEGMMYEAAARPMGRPMLH